MNNIFAVYKPKGMTSHDVVDKVRKITGERRVGHAGTLDPLAEGVLVIGVGRDATRQLSSVVKKEKEYVATIKLGYVSETDDEEGLKTEVNISLVPKKNDIKKALINFTGKIRQVPPQFSAVKIKGKPAYKSARKGEEVKLKEREVFIKEIKLLDYFYPLIKIKVITGPGVYIRSLARDLGKKLGIGAYLSDLERTRVGEYTLNEVIFLNNLEKIY